MALALPGVSNITFQMSTNVGFIAEDEKEEVCLAFLPEVMNKLDSCSSFITLSTTTENTTTEVLPTSTQSSTSTTPPMEDISETTDISQDEKEIPDINDHKEIVQNDVKIEEMTAYNVAMNAHSNSWNFGIFIILVLFSLVK